MVTIQVDDTSFAALLSGLYISSHDTNILAIPEFVWLMIASELKQYMSTWMYEVQSLEDWISNSLLITVKEVLSDDELKELSEYPIYLEIGNGNATLLIAGDIIWLD